MLCVVQWKDELFVKGIVHSSSKNARLLKSIVIVLLETLNLNHLPD